MPKLEIDPSREGRDENSDSRVQVVPPLSDFNADRDNVQWRLEALRPLLYGPENYPSASGEVTLNGSQHFEQVYGSGAEAEAFRSSVEGTFQFLTNLTRYHGSDSSESLNVAQNGGSEAADTEPPGTEPVVAVVGDKDSLQSSSDVTPRRHSLAAGGDIPPMRRSHAAHGSAQPSGTLALQSWQPRSSSMPSMDLRQRSVGLPAADGPDPPQGFEVLSEQQSSDLSAQMIEESLDTFDAGEEGGGQGIAFVLPSNSLLILQIPRRRHHSVEVLSC